MFWKSLFLELSLLFILLLFIVILVDEEGIVSRFFENKLILLSLSPLLLPLLWTLVTFSVWVTVLPPSVIILVIVVVVVVVAVVLVVVVVLLLPGILFSINSVASSPSINSFLSLFILVSSFPWNNLWPNFSFISSSFKFSPSIMYVLVVSTILVFSGLLCSFIILVLFPDDWLFLVKKGLSYSSLLLLFSEIFWPRGENIFEVFLIWVFIPKDVCSNGFSYMLIGFGFSFEEGLNGL